MPGAFGRLYALQSLIARGALSEQSFRQLYAARATSLLGDSLLPVALPFAVLSVDASATALGLVLAARYTAWLSALLIAGVIADRLPRRNVLIASDLIRAVTQATAAGLLIAGRAELWHLVALFGLYGAGQAFFMPTSTGLVPQTVSPERLQQANGLLSLTTSVLTIAGPGVAALIVATAGAGWAIGLDAVTFLLSAMFLARLRVPPAGRAAASSFLRELRDGWREFTSRTWLWADCVYGALGGFAVLAPFLALGPLVADASLGGAPAWALIVTGNGLGAVAGGLIVVRARIARPLLVGIPLLALLAVPSTVLGLGAPALMVSAAAFAGGLGLAVFNTLFETVVQEQIPPHAISRVASIDWMLSNALLPVGFAAAGPLADRFGIASVLLVGAGWLVASSAVMLAIPSIRGMTRRASGE